MTKLIFPLNIAKYIENTINTAEMWMFYNSPSVRIKAKYLFLTLTQYTSCGTLSRSPPAIYTMNRLISEMILIVMQVLMVNGHNGIMILKQLWVW